MWLSAPQVCTGMSQVWEGDCPCAYLAKEHPMVLPTTGVRPTSWQSSCLWDCELPALLCAHFMYLWELDRVSCYKQMISWFLSAFFGWPQRRLDLKGAGINTAQSKVGLPIQISAIWHHEAWEKEEQRLCRCFFRASSLPMDRNAAPRVNKLLLCQVLALLLPITPPGWAEDN